MGHRLWLRVMDFIMILIVDRYHLIHFLPPMLEIDIIIDFITMIMLVLIMSKGGDRIWGK